MAAALALQIFPHSGGAISYTTTGAGGLATTGNTTPVGDDTALLVKNGSGASINVWLRLASNQTIDGVLGAQPAGAGGPARQVVVNAGADEIIPLPTIPYADPVTGLCTFELSATTTISVACITSST